MQAGREVPCDANRSVVLIVDEMELRRVGFASVIELWARADNLAIETIAPADVEVYAAVQRDVKLIIISLGGRSIKEPHFHDLATSIGKLYPGKPCAVVSDRAEAEEAIAAAALRMPAFLSTNMEAALVCQALTFVLGGGTYFPREALLQSASVHAREKRASQNQERGQSGLTQRQIEVLERLGLGQSNKQIARYLKMQESTVKVHMRQIMSKLGATNRTQAALLAVSATISHLPSSESEAPLASPQLDKQEADA